MADFPAGKVHRVTYSFHVEDAWREMKQTSILFIFSEHGSDYIVLDATCTHLGCNVHWQEEQSRFSCPCHDGIFSREGVAVSGPVEKPLRQFQTKIENGVLLALV